MDNPAVLQLLETRRTIPAAFLGDPGPSPQHVERLVRIAMRVPDHGKLAPWRFVAMDRAIRQALAPKLRTIRLALDPELPHDKRIKDEEIFVHAPLCLVVVSSAKSHPKIPLWEQELSVGASTMNLMIAAQAMGFSAQWLTGWATYDADAKALFGIDEGEKIAGFIHIGTPSAPPSERPRPAVGDHLTWLGA